MLFCDPLARTQPYSEEKEFKNGCILIFSALEIKAIGPSEAEIWRQKGPYLPLKRWVLTIFTLVGTFDTYLPYQSAETNVPYLYTYLP